MGLNVISNFAASVAHRNLVMSDAQATLSLAKISSGKRVLSAKDDAASLAIGSRLRAEVEALKQANQNTSQAASMLQIADGGFATISDMLVRLKTLSVQAASGQLSSNERSVLDGEFQALLSEIDRISNDTEFNGTALIAGGAAVFTNSQFGTTSELGGGAAPGITVTFDTANINTAKVSSADLFRISYDYTSGTSQNLTITNLTSGDRQTVDVRTALDSLVAAQSPAGTADTGDLVAGQDLVVNFDSLGIKVNLDEFFDRNVDIVTEGALAFQASTNITATTSTATFTASGLDNADLDALLSIGSYDATTGLLTLNITDGGAGTTFHFAGTAGIHFGVDGVAAASTTANTYTDGAHTVTVVLASTSKTIATLDLGTGFAATNSTTGTIVLDVGQLLFGTDYTSTGTSTTFTFKVGSGTTTNVDDLTFTITAASSAALSINGTSVTNVTNADAASLAVSSAIDTLNNSRAVVGAAQNRLSFASTNLASAIENSEAARSDLLDLDIAAEMTVFTGKQILVQTGVSMLAQANQLPQNLLRLFQ